MLSSRDRAAVPDGSSSDLPMQKIVEDAQLALGFPYVVLSTYDEERGTTRSVATGGLQVPAVQRAMRLLARVLPNYDLTRVEVPADGNEHVRAVFREARTVIAPLSQVVHASVPAVAIRIAEQVVGVTHCLMVPLHVGKRVFGALTCLERGEHFTESQVRTACAFASQLALGLLNAELLAEQRRITLALAESRRLISEAEERTRREMSEFLHSRVQSRLLVAWYRLGELQGLTPEQAERVDRVRRDLEDLRERDVRAVSHQLHPEALSVGLIAALQVLASRLSGVVRVGIHADAAVGALDDPLDNQLPMALRLAVFRSIEEAVGNVLKHSGAAHVTVLLTVTDAGELRLEVVDDGRGFDSLRIRPGLGLQCLAARIESFGGRWGIESREGGPTRLWAEVSTDGAR